MKPLALLIHFILVSFCGFCQDVNQLLLGEITGDVSEVSGIVMTENGRLLSIGDSGNEPRIYELDLSGAVIHSILIEGAQNVDWEELQLDDQGSIYIGDIGNNLGQRSDLQIYVISNIEEKLDQDTISEVEIISINYSDQTVFDSDPNTPFDAEGFIIRADEIHLFSKNRGDPTYTKRYILPNTYGTHTAVLTDSTQLGVWTTGSAYDAELDKLVLCSDQQLAWFENYSDSGFTEQSCVTILDATQIEGVCFSPAKECLLVEDIESGFPSVLFRVLANCNAELSIELWPNPAPSSLTVSSSTILQKLELHDSHGNLIYKVNFQNGILRTWLDIDSLAQGTYFITAYSYGGRNQKRFVKL